MERKVNQLEDLKVYIDIRNEINTITSKNFIEKSKELEDYINYEYDLARILFVILRIDEDLVKGFLSNIFKDLEINVERRDSRYSKDKYYLKFPDLINNSFIDVQRRGKYLIFEPQ